MVREHPLSTYAPRGRGGVKKSGKSAYDSTDRLREKRTRGGGGGKKSRKICVRTLWMLPKGSSDHRPCAQRKKNYTRSLKHKNIRNQARLVDKTSDQLRRAADPHHFLEAGRQLSKTRQNFALLFTFHSLSTPVPVRLFLLLSRQPRRNKI